MKRLKDTGEAGGSLFGSTNLFGGESAKIAELENALRKNKKLSKKWAQEAEETHKAEIQELQAKLDEASEGILSLQQSKVLQVLYLSLLYAGGFPFV